MGGLGTSDPAIDRADTEPTTSVDINAFWPLLAQALRTCKSQEDGQQAAEIFEGMPEPREHLHQAFPPVEKGSMTSGLW